VSGLSAAGIARAPNLAIGDVLGSCVFNLLILSIVDFLQRHEPVYARASRGHILSAGFGVILIGFVGFTILVDAHGPGLAIGHVGVSSLFFFGIYAVAMRTVFRYEREHREEFAEEIVRSERRLSLRRIGVLYAAWAAVIVVMGTWLPFVGRQMAVAMGWQTSFVGTLFVAFATSVPEMAVTVAAVRLGAVDLAIGNLFGSNLFNIAILALDDVVYTPGPLLAAGSPVMAVPALSAVMMTGVAIVGLLYRPKTQLFRAVGWAALLLLLVYLMNAYVLFLYGD